MARVGAIIEISAPRAPLLSLRSSSPSPPPGLDEHWVDGVVWTSRGCAVGRVFEACTSTAYGADAANDMANQGRKEYQPFVIDASDRCSSFGWQKHDFIQRATEKLESVTDFQLEKEFWGGALIPGNIKLAEGSATVLTAAAYTPINALACLENALGGAAGGGQGMIHASRQLVTTWVQSFDLERQGNTLYTKLGTIVVPGVGYPGTGPAGQATGVTQWAYATGLVTVLVSPIVVQPDNLGQALDRVANTITYRAQRFAAAVYDGCRHFAAQVALPYCGS